MGMGDPRADVVGDDVDSSGAREAGRLDEAMQVA
jgi:hypothetical protein